VVVYNCAYNSMIEYEWDPVKAHSNQRKHRIHFTDAVAIFVDEQAVTIIDEEERLENRYITPSEWMRLGEFWWLFILGAEIAFDSFLHGKQRVRNKYLIQVTYESRI